MSIFRLITLVFSFCLSDLRGETIQTFYGPLEVEEPVLLELIHSPAFERLQHIHQYGVAYYTKTHTEEYTRYAHSLGVFALLRTKNASLEEQISGLLHDVSHTAFSHVGDWVFAIENQEEDYQSAIHDTYLINSGIEKILNRHGFSGEQISPKRKEFTMLEQPLPNLCADRIDYNIQGAYFQKFITFEEAQKIFLDLSFQEGKWILKQHDLAAKLVSFSLFMTKNCWGSAANYITSKWLAETILQGIKIGIISWPEFQSGIDQDVWDRLSATQDPFIATRMHMLHFPDLYYRLVNPLKAQLFIPFKCRGIDPWINQDGKIIRLTSIYPELEEALQNVRKQSIEGWPVQMSFLENNLQENS
jgi:hypothetical protein